MKTNLLLILAVFLAAIFVVGAGCQQQGTGTGGTQSFSDIYGKGNGKCTATNGTTEVTWWVKNEDYKLDVKLGGKDEATIVKKGDMVYTMSYEANKCISYNMKEMMALLNQTQEPQAMQGTDAAVGMYKGYNFVCTTGIVTDSDITILPNCEDMTETMKQAYAQAGQACSACQQNPQAFGGDCSQYCK
jgi:hypothetical protein